MLKSSHSEDVDKTVISHGAGRDMLKTAYRRIEMRNRERQRANRKAKRREEALDRRSGSGYQDLTPFNAVNRIRTNGKAQIALK